MNKRKRNANKKHRKNITRVKNLQKESLKLKKVKKTIKIEKVAKTVEEKVVAKKAPAKKKTAAKK